MNKRANKLAGLSTVLAIELSAIAGANPRIVRNEAGVAQLSVDETKASAASYKPQTFKVAYLPAEYRVRFYCR